MQYSCSLNESNILSDFKNNLSLFPFFIISFLCHIQGNVNEKCFGSNEESLLSKLHEQVTTTSQL